MIFVDTNYFLRLLLKDVAHQHQEAKKLFQEGALGKIKLFSSVIVFFEIYWVLSSFYQQRKSKITSVLSNILSINFIKFEKRNLLKKAVAIFHQTNLDLEDAFNLTYAHQMKAIDFKTFDKKLSNQFKKLT